MINLLGTAIITTYALWIKSLFDIYHKIYLYIKDYEIKCINFIGDYETKITIYRILVSLIISLIIAYICVLASSLIHESKILSFLLLGNRK